MKPQNLLIGALVGLDLPLLSAAVAHELFNRAACTSNACLSVVNFGAKPGGPGGCKHFFETTVIPSTVFKTVTGVVTQTHNSTSTITVTTNAGTTTITPSTFATPTPDFTTYQKKLRARGNPATTKSATDVPPYASKDCTNTKQYSSACSCIGQTQATITSVPTVTKHASSTKTKTSTVVTTQFVGSLATITETTTTVTSFGCSMPQSTFYLQAEDYGATYLAYPTSLGNYGNALALGTPQDNGVTYNATKFSRDSSCRLIDSETGNIASTSFFYYGSQHLRLDPPLVVQNNNYTPLVCLPQDDGTEQCFDPARSSPPTLMESCYSLLSITAEFTDDDCTKATVYEIPINGAF